MKELNDAQLSEYNALKASEINKLETSTDWDTLSDNDKSDLIKGCEDLAQMSFIAKYPELA